MGGGIGLLSTKTQRGNSGIPPIRGERCTQHNGGKGKKRGRGHISLPKREDMTKDFANKHFSTGRQPGSSRESEQRMGEEGEENTNLPRRGNRRKCV